MTSTTESNPKKRSHNGAGKNEDPVIFKILEGNMKTSDYASLCLLVPEAVAEELAEALRKARSGGQFVWTIGDDEITDIQNIPAQIAHPIRSIGEIPSDKTESELLDWLMHGESYFSKKYVIVSCGNQSSNTEFNQVYEITEKEHLKKFTDALEDLLSTAEENGFKVFDGSDMYLNGWYVIDRGNYLLKFHEGACNVVNDDLVECFEFMAKKWYIDDDLLRRMKSIWDEE